MDHVLTGDYTRLISRAGRKTLVRIRMRRRFMSRELRLALTLTTLTSGIVLFEPAPCDIFFLPLAVLAFLSTNRPDFGAASGLYKFGSFVFIAGTCLSGYCADDIGRAVLFGSITAYLLLSCYTYSRLIAEFGQEALNKIIFWYVTGAVAVALLVVMARFNLVPHSELFWRDPTGLRMRGTFKDPNVLAPYLVMAQMFFFLWFLERPRYRTANVGIFVCGFGLLVLALVFAFSRAAFIHFGVSVASFVLCALLIIRNPRTSLRLIIWSAIVFVIATYTTVALLYTLRLNDVLRDRLQTQDYDAYRWDAQARAWKMFQEHWLGIGPGQWTNDTQILDMHNLYLRILTENGAIAFLGFCILLSVSVGTCVAGICRRGPFANTYNVALSLLLGILVSSFVIDTLHWRHFFLALAIGPGLSGFERWKQRAASAQGPGFIGRKSG